MPDKFRQAIKEVLRTKQHLAVLSLNVGGHLPGVWQLAVAILLIANRECLDWILSQ